MWEIWTKLLSERRTFMDVGVGKAHFAFFFILRYIVVLCMRHLVIKYNLGVTALVAPLQTQEKSAIF